MPSNKNKYKMSLSLNVLNHLGLSLYSNVPAVLAEVIANAWDADATEARVEFDYTNKTITVSDNGHGMNLNDINSKYLYVGYQKRGNNTDFRTPAGRKPMGRKGIGKLSLFAIANQIFVYSKGSSTEGESFLMDAQKVKDSMLSESPNSQRTYQPEPVDFDADISSHGTIIKIKKLKKVKLTKATATALKKRIARRFCIVNAEPNFHIIVNGSPVTFSDRDYFHKARFIFQYGDYDYAKHCTHLDTDEQHENKKLSFTRECRFDQKGVVSERGKYRISGWIAIAHHSNDLDDHQQDHQNQDENLNKITIVVRGKVAQEDILQEHRIGGMITKYMYGEINADFLDEDDKDDIATSSRQKISEDDPRYCALKSFIGNELQHIWIATNTLKEKKGLEKALRSNPHIREWYEAIQSRKLQSIAKKIFADVDKAGIDESDKQKFYANGIIAFEALKMNHALDRLESVDASNLNTFLDCLADIDAIEAARYHEIVQGRLDIIQRLENQVSDDSIERVLQEYVFGHLWLLDPAWERATEYQHMEETIQKVIDRVTNRYKYKRVDIRYRRVMGSHVIVELKRSSHRVGKPELEKQVCKYIDAVKEKLLQTRDDEYPIEAVCIVGKLPAGWNNPNTKEKDEKSLAIYNIRVITYNELISNARSAYLKFIQASVPIGKIREQIEKIRHYKPKE